VCEGTPLSPKVDILDGDYDGLEGAPASERRLQKYRRQDRGSGVELRSKYEARLRQRR